MNRRIRGLAALLALIGFTAFFAEGLLAVSCGAPAAVATEAAAAHAHDGMHHPAPAPAESGSDAPQCPMGMAGGTSCLASATLPTNGPSARVPGIETEQGMAATADAALDLIVRTPFHPPRS